MKIDTYIGWDIGGAHLKMAQVDASGRVIFADQLPTPLWHGLDILRDSLRRAKQWLPDNSLAHAITTTAELSDIFKDRHSGLRQLAQLVSGVITTDKLQFYAGRTGWVGPGSTDEHADAIASANWHATASFAASQRDTGILIDIGSTTTDIIPFSAGRLLNAGYTDYERLACGELVYTGVVRTPIMALTMQVPLEGQLRPVVAEHFATMADVYRLTGELAEADDMMTTADGAGKTRLDSARRLARMVALDQIGPENQERWIIMAQALAQVQLEMISTAFEQIVARMQLTQKTILVGAGAGRFLVTKLAQRSGHDYVDFAELINASADILPLAARSATAVSVAQLARLSR